MKTYEIIGALAVHPELDTVIVDGDEEVLSCDVHALSECLLIEKPTGERYISACFFNKDDKIIKKVNVICANDYWPSENRTEWKAEKKEDGYSLISINGENIMIWFSTHDKQPKYNQRCLCKLTDNNLYSVLVYIPMLGTTDKSWYNELSAMYYNLDFVESWCPLANIINM